MPIEALEKARERLPGKKAMQQMLENDIRKWSERMHSSYSLDKAGGLSSAVSPVDRQKRGSSLASEVGRRGGAPPKNAEELRSAKEFVTVIISLGLGTGLPLGKLSQEYK